MNTNPTSPETDRVGTAWCLRRGGHADHAAGDGQEHPHVHVAEGDLLVFVSDLAEKDALLASDPKKFFTTPHYDGHQTVLVNLKAVTST